MKYRAAIFDFDGTVTEKGVYSPSQEMADALVDLAHQMPIAFCTGRQLESFLHRGLGVLMEEIVPEKRESFLKNLFLMAENGSVGYYYDEQTANFKEFYKVEWPEAFVPRVKLMKMVDEAVKEHGEVYYNAHKVIIVVRTNLHNYDERNVEDVYALSDKIYEVLVDLMQEFDKDFERHVHVGNSGIGCLICPAKGDKDRGVREFADFLRKNRGMEFDEEAREILVIGDRPQPSGNDYYLLKGDVGSPFTVGCLVDGAEFPKPVLDSSGKRLQNAVGTLHMIRGILN